jgi:hypothetical protein
MKTLFGTDFNNRRELMFQVPAVTFSSCDKLLSLIQSSNFSLLLFHWYHVVEGENHLWYTNTIFTSKDYIFNFVRYKYTHDLIKSL